MAQNNLKGCEAGQAKPGQPDDVKSKVAGHLSQRPYYTVELANGTTVECMMLIRALGLPFALANVLKYVWRAGKKTPSRLADLKKAAEYLADEIRAIEQEENP